MYGLFISALVIYVIVGCLIELLALIVLFMSYVDRSKGGALTALQLMRLGVIWPYSLARECAAVFAFALAAKKDDDAEGVGELRDAELARWKDHEARANANIGA